MVAFLDDGLASVATASPKDGEEGGARAEEEAEEDEEDDAGDDTDDDAGDGAARQAAPIVGGRGRDIDVLARGDGAHEGDGGGGGEGRLRDDGVAPLTGRAERRRNGAPRGGRALPRDLAVLARGAADVAAGRFARRPIAAGGRRGGGRTPGRRSGAVC